MRAAFAECELKGVDSVGWRAEVEKKGMTKGRKKERRVLVFGQWFKLDDPDMIRPVRRRWRSSGSRRGGLTVAQNSP